MNILIIAPLLPFPLTDGGRKGVYYPVKYLSERGHQIHYACLVERNDETAIREMEKYCTLHTVIHSKKPTLIGAAKSLFSSTPYELSRFHNMELLRTIFDLLTRYTFDIVQVEGIHSFFYGLEIKKKFDIPIVLRVHNVHSMNFLRLIENYQNPFLKLLLWYEARKILNYECRESEKLDSNLAVSEVDRQIVLKQNKRNKCKVVPAGVDLSEFVYTENQTMDNSILWLGNLQWVPNQDSFWWFYNEIVPKIILRKQDIQINVVGSNPPQKILDIKHPNVNIIGQVEDVREYLQRASVCVVPLRAGSGIRLKLLEMFAMKKAVVSTSVGCEGLNVKNGVHLLISDEPSSFADAVINLLQNEKLREQLSENCLLHVTEHFSWEKIAIEYEKAYQEVINNFPRRQS
jgi:glycosyltransferase involved in cell wall biosynthesis